MQSKKLLLLISLGAILEYYDFAIFIYLAPLIGKSLIPVQNPMVNLILSFAIFAIGAFFRPLGGMLFAHFGDTKGRNSTFIYTILFMALPTLLIAFIPNIHMLGVGSTLILIILRICQGIAIGGEIPGSIVFGYEVSKLRDKAFNSSLVILGTNLGFVLASLMCMLIVKIQCSIVASWRLAFILGGIFGLIGYFLRKRLKETPAFNHYKRLINQETVPINLLLTKYTKEILQLLPLGCFLASSLAVFTFYMPTYLTTFYAFPLAKVLQFNSYTIIIFILASLIAGIFAQYFGKKFFLLIIPLFVLISLALFFSYPYLSLTQIFMVHILLLFMIGILCGRLPVLAATFFPIAVRYSGVALVYNLSFGIVAGVTQMLLTWLIKLSGILWLPAIYLFIFGAMAVVTLVTINSKRLINYQR